MNSEFSFSISTATLNNLKELSDSASQLEERRICELYELAVSLCAYLKELSLSEMGVCEKLSLIAPLIYDLPESTSDSAFPRLSNHIKLISKQDRAVLSQLICDTLAIDGAMVRESDFLNEGNQKETFVYVKNTLADEAYDVFSQDFKSPTVSYVSTFRDALARVASGEVGYCLLPIEERGARIASVAELIFKGDFKIVSVTPVLGFDGLADMKYALVSRLFYLPKVLVGDDRYLEIRLPVTSKLAASELLSAIEFFGADIYRMNTVTFSSDGVAEQYYSIVIHLDSGDFSRILAYLTLFAEDVAFVGVYKNIEL